MAKKKAKTIMIQGTGSYVGKSVIVAALCRIFRQDGFRVAPFKSQNMALNSFVTREGGEMGRAQVTQAEAAGIEPSVDMNPILLKPSTDVKAQVVVKGSPIGNMSGKEYYRRQPKLLKIIKESFERLRSEYDIVVIEGAGSPAEINLRKNDIVNMRMARIADSPVLLVGDINVGGVFAWLAGTLELLNRSERNRIKGVLINKFRGDIDILKPGLELLEKKIKRPVLGVIPYFRDINIPEEDSVAREKDHLFEEGTEKNKLNIEVIYLPHISNFTDFDPLEKEPGVKLRYIAPGRRVGNPDCIIIPGSKNTIGDMLYLKKSGLAKSIIDKAGTGVTIIGICGGYQMLGKEIKDPHSAENRRGAVTGLGILPLTTTILKKKLAHQVQAEDMLFNSGKLKGYEIHMGKTDAPETLNPVFKIRRRSGKGVNVKDGAISRDKKVWGTYIHGLFENDIFRRRFIDSFRKTSLRKRSFSFARAKEREYDKLADLIRKSVDMKKIYALLDG